MKTTHIAVLLCLVAGAFAQTTPNLGFNIPTTGSQVGLWGPLINSNFTVLDNSLYVPLTAVTTTVLSTSNTSYIVSSMITVPAGGNLSVTGDNVTIQCKGWGTGFDFSTGSSTTTNIIWSGKNGKILDCAGIGNRFNAGNTGTTQGAGATFLRNTGTGFTAQRNFISQCGNYCLLINGTGGIQFHVELNTFTQSAFNAFDVTNGSGSWRDSDLSFNTFYEGDTANIIGNGIVNIHGSQSVQVGEPPSTLTMIGNIVKNDIIGGDHLGINQNCNAAGAATGTSNDTGCGQGIQITTGPETIIMAENFVQNIPAEGYAIGAFHMDAHDNYCYLCGVSINATPSVPVNGVGAYLLFAGSTTGTRNGIQDVFLHHNFALDSGYMVSLILGACSAGTCSNVTVPVGNVKITDTIGDSNVQTTLTGMRVRNLSGGQCTGSVNCAWQFTNVEIYDNQFGNATTPWAVDAGGTIAPMTLTGTFNARNNIPQPALNPSVVLGGTQSIALTSQYTNSTTSFTNVTGGVSIAFTAAPSGVYTATCSLYYQAASTGGLNIEFTGPASPTSVAYSLSDPGAPANVVATAYSTSLGAVVGTAATNFPATVTFHLVNGSTGGTVQMLAKSSAAVQLQIQPNTYCLVTSQ